ncbi:MAG: chemotaxis response regulator protein-glutamate methylesterase [Opitutaceae bacterium]|nr:chemotaxis response regulator protein-glutamate methylesterase [Opitutaceae bacterium]
MNPPKIRVLVVDDSAVVRKLVSTALAADPEIEVVGTAVDPYAARDQIVALAPDVLTLDLEMPRMDGLTFLRILMAQRPMPVVVMSSLTQNGSDCAWEALRLGAVDVLGKPGGVWSMGDFGPQLAAKVKAAAGARLHPMPDGAPPISGVVAPRHPRALILLGASTGGTEALRAVLTRLPDGLPPIAIVQHIPAVFSRAFAERLDQMCAFKVVEARDGDVLRPGEAYVAPGDFHLLLRWQDEHYRAQVVAGPPVWHQRPAVDLLLKSAADAGAGARTIAGVLTGMGKDGAEGLLRLRDRGAITFAQDEATSVVYGMPRVAWETGAAQRQVALTRMPEFICRQVESLGTRRAAAPSLRP